MDILAKSLYLSLTPKLELLLGNFCETFLGLGHRVLDKIRNRQILEQLLHIRSCVLKIALSNYWNTSYTAMLQNPNPTCSNDCSEQLSEHQLHSTTTPACKLSMNIFKDSRQILDPHHIFYLILIGLKLLKWGKTFL